QLLGVHLVDVVLLHDRQDVGEGLEPFVGLLGNGRDLLDGEAAEAEDDEADGHRGRRQPGLALTTDHSLYPTGRHVTCRGAERKTMCIRPAGARQGRRRQTRRLPCNAALRPLRSWMWGVWRCGWRD